MLTIPLTKGVKYQATTASVRIADGGYLILKDSDVIEFEAQDSKYVARPYRFNLNGVTVWLDTGQCNSLKPKS